jgi:hypothetical protein
MFNNSKVSSNNIVLIPKYIHFCWFGEGELPQIVQTCIASWKKLMPDHDIIKWDENNSPMDVQYMKRALSLKKFANMSNYMRLWALRKMGGWYFDTDILLLKTPNLTKYSEDCFLGLETKPWEQPFFVNNAVIAAIPNCSFINNCLNTLTENFDGTEEANMSSPHLTTFELRKLGFQGKPCSIKNIRIFSHDFFYPSSWYEDFDIKMATKNSICVHYNHGSWIDLSSFDKMQLLNLLKENYKNKNELHNFMNGRVSIKQFVFFNIKFYINLLKFFIRV